METLWKDFRFALRTLRRSLSVTVLATASLALAIAGNTLVFSLVNGLLYRPLPYEEAHRLVLLGERTKDTPRGQIAAMSDANFLDVFERQTSFETLAALRNAPVNLDRGAADPEPVGAASVSTEFFSVLGTQPLRGRFFLPEETTPGKDRVAVISHGFWNERYGASPSAVGEVLKLNGETYDIVGVLPEDFEFLTPNTEIYLPLAFDRAQLRRQSRNLIAVARLTPGVSQESAQAEMATIMTQLEEEYPQANRGYTADVLNLRHDIPNPATRTTMKMLQGGLLFVMLIACANIANLLLARSQSREREIAIRTSMGATRRRIVFQLVTESMVMAMIAGAAGLALAVAGVKTMASAMGAQLPSVYAPTIDVNVLVFTLAVTLLGGLLFGLAPVLQTRRFQLVDALKDGTQSSTSGGRRRFAANTLVVVEIALALVLLGGASVMIRAFQNLQSSDPGFETSNFLTFQLALPEARNQSPEAILSSVEQLTERLGNVAGVQGVTYSSFPPRSPIVPQTTFSIDGEASPEGESLPQIGWTSVNPDYFGTIGISVEHGRVFTPADSVGSPYVVVINQDMAQRYFSGRDPVGRRITIRGESREVVGVVATVRHGLAVSDALASMIYLPWRQDPVRATSFALKTEVEPASLAEAVRREVFGFEPTAAVQQMQTLDQFIQQFFVGQNIITAILSGFGTLALFLAALGTYGVLAYSVAQRTHEIGVRIAIGAGRGQVMRMVARQGLTLAAVGVALGVPGVILVTRAISKLLSGFMSVEPTTVVVVGAVLTAVTLLASLVPARRAASVDPIEALRCD